MLKKLLLSLFFVGSVHAAEPVMSVFFETDKYETSDQDLENARELVNTLQKYESYHIVLVGHADKRGSRLYNYDLATNRASAVKLLLVQLGVKPDLIIAEVSNGEERPLAPNDDLPGHLHLNRRVDVFLLTHVVKKQVVMVPKTVEVEKLLVRRHRVSLLGGFAPSGLNLKSPLLGVNKITQDYDWEAGLGYQFLTPWLDNRLSIGATGYTNKSGFLSIGLDF